MVSPPVFEEIFVDGERAAYSARLITAIALREEKSRGRRENVSVHYEAGGHSHVM
jgi:hypothetical protein